MQLDQKLKRHRFPVSIISQAVWMYHRFNHSYRDVQEQLLWKTSRGVFFWKIYTTKLLQNYAFNYANFFSWSSVNFNHFVSRSEFLFVLSNALFFMFFNIHAFLRIANYIGDLSF